MNKKIYKGYELFKMIAKNELTECCKIKDTKTDHIVIWDGINFRQEEPNGRYFNETIDDAEFAIREFEILEDNTEEIEELEKCSDGISYGYRQIDIPEKINELVRAVNQLRKENK